MIHKQSFSKYSIISITNYDQWQTGHKQATSRPQASHKQTTTPKESKEVKKEDMFQLFYDAYAKKVSRGQAEKAWAKIPPVDHLKIIEAAKSAARIGGDFRQHPATWLNAKGYLDEHEGELINGELFTKWKYGIKFREDKGRWPNDPKYYYAGKLSECPTDLRSAHADLFPSVN